MLYSLYRLYSVTSIILMKEGDFIEYESFEEQRYGRNKDTLVNHAYINSGTYRRKFDLITDSKKINSLLYKLAKKILTHRSGSLFDDMYWIDVENEKVIASEVSNKRKKRISYSKTTRNLIKKRHNIITIHSHPHSYPPSIEDFNSNYIHNYNLSVICCHNGRLFIYTSNCILSENDYKIAIVKYRKQGYNEYEAQMKTLTELCQKYDISFKEVLL